MAALQQLEISGRAWLGLVLLGSLALYANVLSCDFAFDDFRYIHQNDTVVSPQLSLKTFAEPTHPGDLYRPLTMFTYALNYAAVGLAPLSYHAIDIVLHGVVSALLFMLFAALIPEREAGLLALLFALHPLHVEAVANIAGRAELLAALFGCSTLILFLKLQSSYTHYSRAQRVGSLSAVSLLFFAALLSKESAVCLLLLTPLVCYFAGSTSAFRRKSFQAPYAACLATLLLYFGVRVAVFGGLASNLPIPFANNPLAAEAASSRVVSAFALLGLYLRQCMLPIEFSADYSFPKLSEFLMHTDPVTLLHLAALLLLAAAATLGLAARNPLSLFVFWFLFAFAATSNIAFPIGTNFGERLAYLPSAGACGLWVMILCRMIPAALRMVGIGVVVTYFVLITLLEIPNWRSNDTLHARELSRPLVSAKMLATIAERNRKAQRYEEALQFAEQARAVFPQSAAIADLIDQIRAEQELNANRGAP